MTEIGFTSLFLGLLLFMNCIRDPLAEARTGWGFTQDADITAQTANAEVAVPSQKETIGDFAAAGTSKMGAVGRKMMVDENLNGGSSRTSGIHADDLSNSMKPGDDEQEALKCARTLGNPRREEEAAPNWVRPPSIRISIPATGAIAVDDEQPPPPPSSSSSGTTREKRLDSLEAANEEIVNLMHRDYSRGPPKARRKPPINNHEPSN
ncbi:hypothetical protein CRG98_024248 [Punica granatum]|nr:hypothetical protein CRG98_024248 [Punica granatum]